MKKILILLLISFNLYSQDIIINENIARWALENNEKVKLYKQIVYQKDSIISYQNDLIVKLETKSIIQDTIISKQNKIINNDNLIIEAHKEEVDFLRKEVKTGKKKEAFYQIIIIIVTILALL